MIAFQDLDNDINVSMDFVPYRKQSGHITLSTPITMLIQDPNIGILCSPYHCLNRLSLVGKIKRAHKPFDTHSDNNLESKQWHQFLNELNIVWKTKRSHNTLDTYSYYSLGSRPWHLYKLTTRKSEVLPPSYSENYLPYIRYSHQDHQRSWYNSKDVRLVIRVLNCMTPPVSTHPPCHSKNTKVSAPLHIAQRKLDDFNLHL